MNVLKKHAEQIIFSAIEAAKPEVLFREKIRYDGRVLEIKDMSFHLEPFDRILILGAGKASSGMAYAMETLFGERIFTGTVSVKYGHRIPCQKTEIIECGHPLLDQNGLDATNRILKLAENAGKKDLVFCLISGGGSALMEKLPGSISLTDLQMLSELMLACGATIQEFNTLRKHLSLVKGGQLAKTIYPATCITLILSDVIGDPIDTIASGPTTPDPTTFSDVWKVIVKYKLEDRVPKTILNHLKKGSRGEISETLKPNDPVFEYVNNIILGSNLESLHAAQKKAEELGYHSQILTHCLRGEAREAGSFVAEKVKQILKNNQPIEKPACLLLGGETTVTLKGSGIGGRNQELSVAALLAMKSIEQSYLIASIGTDGTDGPTDAAGGMVTQETWKIAKQKELHPEIFLSQNNTYPFLDLTSGLVKTGPTGTNVMDIVVALIPEE
jgi:glycerate-2-kinase